MSVSIYQLRYYGSNSDQNWPNDLTNVKLSNGQDNWFKDKKIKQIGIQTLPGIKFYVNGSEHPIVVGSTGIYELTLNNLISIESLYFDEASLDLIQKNNAAYLIIDILYEGISNTN